MKQEVSIRLEADTLAAVQSLAQLQGKSLSAVVEEVLTHAVFVGSERKTLTTPATTSGAELRTWRGAFRLLEEPTDYKQILAEQLMKKYS